MSALPFFGCLSHPLRGVANRVDDVRVTGAATEVAGERLADLFVAVDVWALAKEMEGGHQEAWRAETTLESVVVAERVLKGVEAAILREALDRRDLGAVGLHREHQAGPRGLTIHEYGACATDAVLAPEVGPVEVHVLAKEVREQPARLDLRLE
jgi:hypothetical protein